jgi:hypothetical protein
MFFLLFSVFLFFASARSVDSVLPLESFKDKKDYCCYVFKTTFTEKKKRDFESQEGKRGSGIFYGAIPIDDVSFYYCLKPLPFLYRLKNSPVIYLLLSEFILDDKRRECSPAENMVLRWNCQPPYIVPIKYGYAPPQQIPDWEHLTKKEIWYRLSKDPNSKIFFYLTKSLPPVKNVEALEDSSKNLSKKKFMEFCEKHCEKQCPKKLGRKRKAKDETQQGEDKMTSLPFKKRKIFALP